MSDRTTLISEWHNITNELPSVKLNSMFFQDMLTIIKNLKDAEILQRWEKVKESLYEHVTDTDNPHKLTSEQLSVNVINVLYSAWLSEGYSGTLQEFIDLLFNYIHITDTINDDIFNIVDENYGKLYAWGNTAVVDDQYGTNPDIGTYTYTPKQYYDTKWKYFASENRIKFGIDKDGYLYTWGVDSIASGLGNAGLRFTSPTQIGNSKWKSISCNSTTVVFAIDENDNLYGWGNNTYGQLGTTNATEYQFTPLKLNNTKWKMISCGNLCTIAIDKNNYLYGWGYSSNGQLGIGDRIETSYQYTPLKLNSTKWKNIQCAFTHTLAIDENDNLYSWGLNGAGQLGIGTNETFTQYTPIQVGITKWNTISCQNSFTSSLGITSEGALYAWGDNQNCQIGGGKERGDQFTPLKLGATKWKFIGNGQYHNLALDENNYLYTWGWNYGYQIGIGKTDVPQEYPIKIGHSKWLAVGGDYLMSWGIQKYDDTEDFYVPTVKALADYIKYYHNAKIIDIHEELLSDIFFGDIIDIPPTIYLNKYIGVPTDLIPENENDYVSISSTGTHYSICIESKYSDQSLFTLKNDTKIITTQLNTTSNKIVVTIDGKRTSLRLKDLFSDTLNTASEILFIFVNNGDTVECYCRLQGMYNDVLVQSNYKKWTITVQAMSNYKQILLPAINDSSNVISFRYDKIAFNEDYAKRILGSYI